MLLNFIYLTQSRHSDLLNPSAPWTLAASWRPAGYCFYCIISYHCWLSVTLQVRAGHLQEVRPTELREANGLFYHFWDMMNYINLRMKSGFCSQWSKVPGNTNYACRWGIRWMPLRMKYGDEKELTDLFLFLPLLDELFCSMVLPYDLSGRSSRIFLWNSGQLGNTPRCFLSILPYFMSLFLFNLSALGFYVLLTP